MYREFVSQPNDKHWPFEDPACASGSEDEVLAKLRRVRDEIAERIQRFVSDTGSS